MVAKIILIASDFHIGGATKHILVLAKSLKRHNFNPVILSPSGWLIEEAKRSSFKSISCDFESAFDFQSLWQLQRIIKQEKPDLIHSHGIRAGVIGYLANLFLNVPTIYSEHLYTDDYHLESLWREKVQLWALKSIAKRSSMVIAPSFAVRKFLIEKLNVPSSKVSVVYNGLENFKIISKESKELKIGFIGSLNRQKGLEYLIKAMFRLTCRYPKLELEIIGDGLLKNQLENQAKELGDKIKFLGKNDSAKDYIGSWKMVVMPSISESFGLVALEAAIAKRPVVATRVGGLSEVVLDKKTGILVQPKNPDSLVKAISYILDHPDIAKKMGQAAYQRFEHKFTAKIMNDRMIKIYNEALNI
jgi:glycosyltransferase involved in cell wall biosynthesis